MVRGGQGSLLREVLWQERLWGREPLAVTAFALGRGETVVEAAGWRLERNNENYSFRAFYLGPGRGHQNMGPATPNPVGTGVPEAGRGIFGSGA